MAYRPPQLQVDRSGRAFVSKMIGGARYRIPMGVGRHAAVCGHLSKILEGVQAGDV